MSKFFINRPIVAIVIAILMTIVGLVAMIQLPIAQYPNIAVKWCHAPGLLSDQDYPYRDLMPLLRKVIGAFGAERIMWASDYTVARDQNGNSWAQCLYYILDSDALSDIEKEWILGRSLRRALNWTASRVMTAPVR